MRKKTSITLEVTGYLILSCAVTIIVSMIWQRINQEPREDVFDTIRWAITLNLLFCALPTMLPFYLFQQQKFVPRLIVPVLSLLLQAVWASLLLNHAFGRAIWQICIFFPALGIAGATVITAYLPAVRQGNFPLSAAKLALGVAAGLLLTVLLPLAIAVLLFLTK